jgi:hypothetical protein
MMAALLSWVFDISASATHVFELPCTASAEAASDCFCCAVLVCVCVCVVLLLQGSMWLVSAAGTHPATLTSPAMRHPGEAECVFVLFTAYMIMHEIQHNVTQQTRQPQQRMFSLSQLPSSNFVLPLLKSSQWLSCCRRTRWSMRTQ